MPVLLLVGDESVVRVPQEILQAPLHDFGPCCQSAIQSIVIALWAAAVPVDSHHKTVAQWNRGALPVAGGATERAWPGW